MHKTAVINAISATFFQLPPACITALYDKTRLSTVDKKTLLVKEGEYADKIYFIAKGIVRAYYLKDGRDITDWLAFENEFIGPIQSFFQGIPSPLYLETLEETTLLEIDRSTINTLSDEFHAFDRLGRIIATKTMLDLQQRIVSIQFETAQHKYESLLKQRPDIELRVPLQHIASFLGITLETLSRIRSKKGRI